MTRLECSLLMVSGSLLLTSPLFARPDAAVRVSSVPSAIVLYREVTGPYDQHAKLFAEMMKYTGENYRSVGPCFGVYPQDPDAVKSTELHWEIGVRVVPGLALGYGNNLPIEQLPKKSAKEWKSVLRTMKAPEAPYKLKVIAPTEAVFVSSTVANAGRDGLAMFPWMAKNGYVQTGPTRMEYLSHDGPPSQIKVTIVVPMQKRASGLRVPDQH